MNFKFGVYGLEKSEVENACGPVLNGPTAFRDMKFQNNFVEFSTEKFWEGMDVIARIANDLRRMYPQKFRPANTKIWIDGEPFEVFLLEKLRIAESGIQQASRLLLRGRSKKKVGESNDLSRRARLKLQETLRTLQLQ